MKIILEDRMKVFKWQSELETEINLKGLEEKKSLKGLEEILFVNTNQAWGLDGLPIARGRKSFSLN